MDEQVEILIIGGGPAGLSAALNARARGKSLLVLSANAQESGLYKAERLDNYLGVPAVTGAEFIARCRAQAEEMGIPVKEGKVLSVMPMGGGFGVSFGPEVFSAKTVILACGIVSKAAYPGEEALLGRGVSYCATCDGMLYRKKRVIVIAKSGHAVEEANFLNEIGCNVTVISDGRDLTGLSDCLQIIGGRALEILGTDRVESVVVDGMVLPCDGVFILRNTVSMQTLIKGLELQDGHIKTGAGMATNIPGVFAAGDCAGRPYQVAKAVGEGQVAALAAAAYLDGKIA